MNDIGLIRLSNGKISLVDADKFLELNQWQWHLFGRYAGRKVRHGPGLRQTIYLQNAIRNATSGCTNDHINGYPLDNRLCNLRDATASQQAWNSAKTGSKTSSRYKGVSWNRKMKKWQASICREYKLITLGFFETEELAATAYNQAAKELFGEYSRGNVL